jgi:beta-aspartyl-peptidase (threonine type)
MKLLSLTFLILVSSFALLNLSYSQNTLSSKAILVIHGGAGTITPESLSPELEKAYKDKLKEALQAGYMVIDTGGTSVIAIQKAIQILEESPLFNAGVGAVFTHNETNELDASIMDGKTLNAGAVAGVSRIKSPIAAAYAVMEKSSHVMLSGEGAEEFAEEQGLEMVDPSYFYDETRHQQLLKIKQNSKATIPPSGDNKFGTVGAVALDKEGNLAAGTSTGGMTNKRYGRIGDSPIIGAGTYASNNTCAVSSTGWGEFYIRNVAAYDIAAQMEYANLSIETAAENTINKIVELGGKGGVICIDKDGNFAMPFSTAGMYRGYVNAEGDIYVNIFK